MTLNTTIAAAVRMTQVAAKTKAMNAKRWKPPSAPSRVAGE
jgi:hypothetical protein